MAPTTHVLQRRGVVPAALLLAITAATPSMAQRPEPTGPAWPDRLRGGTVIPGQVVAVDQARGTVTVRTPSGDLTPSLSSSPIPVRPGDRVDVQVVPTTPVVPGGPASEPGIAARLLPPLPPAQPGAGLQEVPAAASP